MMKSSNGARSCAYLSHFRIVSLIVLLSVISTTTMAKDFYGVIDIGKSSFGGSCLGYEWMKCTTTPAAAARLGLGYRVSPNFGIEVSYGSLGNRKVSGTYAGTPVSGIEKLTAVQFALIGTAPISDSFSFFGKLAGVEALSNYTTDLAGYESGKSSYPGWSAGVGARYDFSKWIAVRAQYESMQFPCTVGCGSGANSLSATQFSTGIMLKF